jgi:hypothetical protein
MGSSYRNFMLREIANRSVCDNNDVAWIRDEFSQFCACSKKARVRWRSYLGAVELCFTGHANSMTALGYR